MEIPFSDPQALESFCMPFLQGEKLPATAAELMASRYVAYTRCNIDYLVETHEPASRDKTDRQATEAWAKSADWKGLEILNTENGGPEDSEGQVEFIARYALRGVDYTHHERAQFKREDGRWYFVDGQRVSGPPVRRSSPKVGRNDPCPCGSGKKYKKCCGA